MIGGTAAEIAATRAAADWQRLPAGAGTKRPFLQDWCYLELANIEAESDADANHGEWTRGLLICRHIADGELAFFTTWCQVGTTIATLVTVEGRRWLIEDSCEAAKNELELDHNRTRYWHGWYRHVSLVILAFARMAAIRHHANVQALKNDSPAYNRSSGLIRWSIQEMRRIANRPAQKRIRPAYIIAWSLWLRAHQAIAQQAHFKSKMHP
jgi:SRSO17 transposase